MHSRICRLALVSLLAFAVTALWQVNGGEVSAQGRHVTIQDNNAPAPRDAFDPDQGRWRFNPANVEVERGEQVVFKSPPGNDHPHTVTNLRRIGGPDPVPVTFRAGEIFDSGRIEPGESWTLETGGLAPGHYPYLCRLHPWMSGEVTVK